MYYNNNNSDVLVDGWPTTTTVGAVDPRNHTPPQPVGSVEEFPVIVADSMKGSATSGYSTTESNTSRSTVKMAKFSDHFENNYYNDDMLMSESGVQTIQTVEPKDRLITDVIVIRHPRSVLILAAIELCVSIKIIVFGLICRFYDGCPYFTSVWIGVIFLAVSIFGVVFVKVYPKRRYLWVYFFLSILCLILTIVLFAITAWLLDQEETLIRQKGWDFLRQRIFEMNRIVENTKIAMYALHLVLTPAYGVCCVGTTVLLYLNVSSPASQELRGYYIANSPLGHQMVLVPVAVKTGADDDITLYHTLQRAPLGADEPTKTLVSTGTQTNSIVVMKK